MSTENKKRNVEEEIEIALQSMQSAELLASSKLYRDAISRLYYVLFHHIRAILLTKGIEPKTHEGLERMFSFHFVKTEIFEGKDSKFLTILAKYRGNADYNPSFQLTGKDYNELHEQLDILIKKIHEYLKSKRYIIE